MAATNLVYRRSLDIPPVLPTTGGQTKRRFSAGLKIDIMRLKDEFEQLEVGVHTSQCFVHSYCLYRTPVEHHCTAGESYLVVDCRLALKYCFQEHCITL